MKTIVFIGANKSGSSREAIKAAERMGYLTVLLTNRSKFLLQRTEFPDVHEMMFSVFTKEHLIQCILELENQGKEIAGILSFLESYVCLACELSDEWGISSFSIEAMRKMENKIETHHVLKGITSPQFEVFHPLDSLPKFLNRHKVGKWIVKPPNSTGSKDVILADGQKALKQAIQHLSNKRHGQPILVEKYLDGPQYLVEALIDSGTVHIVAVIKQSFSEINPFVVTGYSIQTDLEEDFYEGLYENVTSIIRAFNFTKGACHLELRFVYGKWKLIEINPRISGGAMNAMIEKAYGINLVEQTIRLYLGQTPELTSQWKTNIYTHYVTVNNSGKLLKVTGRNRAARCQGVEQVYVKPRKGTMIAPPVSMGKRYAYVIAKGDTSEQAKINAQTAAKELHFHLEEEKHDNNRNAFSP
ncbi:ATP-grasp domain-containing protein [Virgibacillus pantothenticus]|uniref:ATP-grasp domain-containing protein n=1 Tax=Virgibacillus pantothenticus TaxID=1473 RepID=UPI0009854EE1|nr:ATP-grasp domain-containing protein [Virgibacillus pantothenticus]